MIIYVVKRPFKSRGIWYTSGQIIKSPECIKCFKSKVSEGKIFAFERKEKGIIARLSILEEKYGVDIIGPLKEYLAEVDSAAEPKPETTEVPPEVVKVPEPAKIKSASKK